MRNSNNPTEVATGLRRLAALVERLDANAPDVRLKLYIGYGELVSAVQLAAIAEDADEFKVYPKGPTVEAAWAGLVVDVSCDVDNVAEMSPRVYTVDELGERSRKAKERLALEPF